MRAFIACLFIALLMTGAPKAQNLTPDQFVAVLHDMKKEWDGLIAIHEKHRAAACKSLTGDEGTICNMLFKTIVERRKANSRCSKRRSSSLSCPQVRIAT